MLLNKAFNYSNLDNHIDQICFYHVNNLYIKVIIIKVKKVSLRNKAKIRVLNGFGEIWVDFSQLIHKKLIGLYYES